MKYTLSEICTGYREEIAKKGLKRTFLNLLNSHYIPLFKRKNWYLKRVEGIKETYDLTRQDIDDIVNAVSNPDYFNKTTA